MTTFTAIGPRRHGGQTRGRTRVARRTLRGRPARRSPRQGLLRAIASGLAAIGIAAILVGISLLPTLADRGAPASASTTTVLVEPNETLWVIARAHPVAGATTAQTVAVLRDLNTLTGSEIPAGSVLVVPSAEDAEAHLAGEWPRTP